MSFLIAGLLGWLLYGTIGANGVGARDMPWSGRRLNAYEDWLVRDPEYNRKNAPCLHVGGMCCAVGEAAPAGACIWREDNEWCNGALQPETRKRCVEMKIF